MAAPPLLCRPQHVVLSCGRKGCPAEDPAAAHSAIAITAAWVCAAGTGGGITGVHHPQAFEPRTRSRGSTNARSSEPPCGRRSCVRNTLRASIPSKFNVADDGVCTILVASVHGGRLNENSY